MNARNLVVVSAGLGQPSSTRLLADRIAAATRGELERRGQRLDSTVVELREHAHDVVDTLLTGFPPAGLRPVLDAVSAAAGLIVVTPVFQAAYSGLFKSFVDVLDDGGLVDKPVLIAATGGTARHSLVLEHAVRPLFAYLRAAVVPTAVYAATEDWAGGGATDALGRRIARAGEELARQLADRPTGNTGTDPFALTVPFDRLLAGAGAAGAADARQPPTR